MADLILRGGTIVDGSGNPPIRADVAIADGRIVAVGPDLALTAAEEFDATGLLVTPGFIDCHTHYDGQATWDSQLLPTSAHGVTTLVMGCCGIGFAPVRKGQEDWLVKLMEGVEDIPGSALNVGLPWNWESYTDYLDTLSRRDYALDVASQIPHSAVRSYVLGARAETGEPASEAEVAAIGRIVRDGIAAGAIGVGTSRVVMHRGTDGDLLPGTFAAESELLAIAEAIRDGGGGLFQIIPSGVAGGVEGDDSNNALNGDRRDRWSLLQEIELMRRLHRHTGQPIAFTFSQNAGLGQIEFDKAKALIADVKAAGEAVYPQFAVRPAGRLTSLDSYHGFMNRPSYRAIAHLPLAERVAEMRKPEVKAAILGEEDDVAGLSYMLQTLPSFLRASLANIYPLRGRPDYEPDPSSSVRARAQAAGRDPLDLLYDYYLYDEGRAVFLWIVANYVDGNLDVVEQVLQDSQYMVGLGDGGAHVSFICDASYSTYLLAHFGKDRTRGGTLPVELLIAKLTGEPAARYGFADRGLIRPGLRADINVIDMARLELERPYLVNDLPAGAQRFLQGASGYVRTIVNGVTTRRDDSDTGARPGRLVRKNRIAAPAEQVPEVA